MTFCQLEFSEASFCIGKKHHKTNKCSYALFLNLELFRLCHLEDDEKHDSIMSNVQEFIVSEHNKNNRNLSPIELTLNHHSKII